MGAPPHPPEPMNLREAIVHAAGNLSAVDALRVDAVRDAEMLLLDTLGVTRAELLANPARELSSSELSVYLEAVGRRSRSEPIQYIIGRSEFYGIPLRVTPAVLIPRPETELLVEAVLDHVRREFPPFHPSHILDVGTGSGAIAIALAANLPHALLTAVDVSEDALEVARENAREHGVEGRVRFLNSDLLAGLAGESFDIVVSNPPYVAESDRETLHPQVREYEPPAALFAGEDGLEIYRQLVPAARAALKPGGLLALELGHGQRDALGVLLEGWSEVR